jgi:hypothetical protein
VKSPLIRQGGGQAALHDLYAAEVERREELRRMVEMAESAEQEQRIRSKMVGRRAAPGDELRLRGIPVVGARGVGGAIPGSRPEGSPLVRFG